MPKDFTIRPDIDLTEVRRKLATLSRSPTTLKLDTKGFKPLGRITGELGEFEKSLAASNARVIAFGASTTIIMGIQRAFSNLIKTTIDVEKQLTDINVIMNASTAGLQKFSKELFRIAGQTGQTFSTIATAATELARQGLTAEETLLRVRDAMILTRLSGMDAVESVSALTAAINSFNKVAVTSTELVNKMANVDAAFAVSAGDLAKAISRVGSSAQSAGVDIDQLMAIVTSAQQTTARGGAVIGNSFKTIFTRIERPRVVKELEKMGVAVKGFAGELLPAVDILNNLAKTFDILTRSERAHIAELVGGVFQVNILKAAMADLNKETSIYSRALGVSAASTNQAIRRNEELNKTLAASLNETIANFQSVGSEIGKLSLEPAIRRVLGITNKLITSGLDPRKAEDTGANIGHAIFKGLGDFLKGPGLAIGGVAIFKLLTKIITFSADAAKSIVGVGGAAKQAAASTQQILGLLTKQPEIIKGIADGTMTIKQAHDGVITALEAETVALRTMDGLAKDVAATLGSIGLTIGEAGLVLGGAGGRKAKGGKRRAAGHVPNAVAETIGAVVGGYTPGKIAQTNIQGLGRVTYNTAETIKQFPGFSQPAIMPPERSQAGKTYRQSFSGKHGFNPYASGGMVPNFAAPVRIKPGKSVSYGGKTINIEEAKVIVKKMDMNPRPGRSSDERTQRILSGLKGGSTSGYNNAASASLLLTNSSLGRSYSNAVKGKADVASAQAAAIEAKKIRQASAPRLSTVLLRNLEGVGTNVHGVARYGMNKNMMPDARERFQSSFETRYKQMMSGMADDMFSQGGAGKMKEKLMSQFTAHGLDKNAQPQVLGRVWESFLQGMGRTVDPRMATSGMARKDFSNYKMKDAFRGLFTPGPATQMGFTGGEARLSGISSKKAYEKMGIDPRLYMAGGHIPSMKDVNSGVDNNFRVSVPIAMLENASGVNAKSKSYVKGGNTARLLRERKLFKGSGLLRKGRVPTPSKASNKNRQKGAEASWIHNIEPTDMVTANVQINRSYLKKNKDWQKAWKEGDANAARGSVANMAEDVVAGHVKGIRTGIDITKQEQKAVGKEGIFDWYRKEVDSHPILTPIQKKNINLELDRVEKLNDLKLHPGGFQSPTDILTGRGVGKKGKGIRSWEVKTGGGGQAGLPAQVNFLEATVGKSYRHQLSSGIVGSPGKGKSRSFLEPYIHSSQPPYSVYRQGRDDINLGTIGLALGGKVNLTASQGFVPNLARKVFDKDAYRNYYSKNPEALQQRLAQERVANINELFDRDLEKVGKKGRLKTAINAPAGAGKTTLAMGTKGSMAYSHSDVRRGDHANVVRVAENIGNWQQKDYFKHIKNFVSLNLDPNVVHARRKSRDKTGVGLHGRQAGTTKGAQANWQVPTSILNTVSGAMGARHRTIGNAPSRVHDLPATIAGPGVFSPFTKGHEKMVNAAKALGWPTLVGVGQGQGTGKEYRQHNIGWGTGFREWLVKKAIPGVATYVTSNFGQPEGFQAAEGWKGKFKGKNVNVLVGEVVRFVEGAKMVLGSDRASQSKTGYKGLFEIVNVPRSSDDVSATKVRAAIKSGNLNQIKKMVPSAVYNVIAANLPVIQEVQSLIDNRYHRKMGKIENRIMSSWTGMGGDPNKSVRIAGKAKPGGSLINRESKDEKIQQGIRGVDSARQARSSLGANKWIGRLARFKKLWKGPKGASGGFIPNFAIPAHLRNAGKPTIRIPDPAKGKKLDDIIGKQGMFSEKYQSGARRYGLERGEFDYKIGRRYDMPKGADYNNPKPIQDIWSREGGFGGTRNILDVRWLGGIKGIRKMLSIDKKARAGVDGIDAGLIIGPQVVKNLFQKISKNRFKKIFPNSQRIFGQIDAKHMSDKYGHGIKGMKSSEMPKMLEEAARARGYKDVSVVRSGNYLNFNLGMSKGFVPNFRTSSMNDALQRSAVAEMSAGQGNVRFGSDPRLVASGNPIGIGTYNTSEGSLSKAIAMHRGSGVSVQSLSSVGKDRQVGNFAEPVPTVADSEAPKFRDSAKKWWAKFRDPRGMTGELDPKTKKPMTKMEVWTSDKEKRKLAKTNAAAMGAGGMGGMGMAMMFGGPMLATVGGRMAEEYGIMGGRSAARFSGGVEQGAMFGMIASFANPFKKFKTAVTLTAAAFGAWRGQLEGGRKFDIEQLGKSAEKATADFTKMANASAKYIETIEAFEAGVTDPRTTPQTLSRLQRQSNESLAKLSPSVRAQLAGGVTPEERRDIVAKGVTSRQGRVEQGNIAARLATEKILGAQAKKDIDAETADRLLSDTKSLAFGLSNFEDIVKAAKGAVTAGQDPGAALQQFGLNTNIGTSDQALLAALEEMKDKGLIEQKLYDQMKIAVGAGGQKQVKAIMEGMAKTVVLEAKTRDLIDKITVAKHKENKELNKFRSQFEDFKASQDTARKLTDISLGAGSRSGKRFLSAGGQAQFQFDASQMKLKGKTSAVIGNIQARLSDTIKEGGGKMLKGLSGEQRARVQGVLAPQEITGGYRMELQSLIGELERGGADNALLSQLINLESNTEDQLRVQKEQTKIQQAIRDAAIQEARELQNINMGGGIRSFMNVDEQNQRFGRLASSSIQTRMGIGNGGRSFVNQSAVMQELLGGDLGAAKGITTAATADAMIPQKRRELLTAANMVEMNARFQRGPQREASLAQAAEARKIANDPARMLEAMTQQAADFFNVDTLKDGVAQGLDNSAVGQAWLKAIPEQRGRDIREPFTKQGFASRIRAEEKAAQRRQSDTSRAGSVGQLTKALNEMTDKITEGLKEVAMGQEAYKAWKEAQEAGGKGGFIPSFNLNRTREMGQAGVSRAQTYQWNVPGFGPAVGNRVHEPSPSALQMAVMSHSNPRSAGASRGFTPNFAGGSLWNKVTRLWTGEGPLTGVAALTEQGLLDEIKHAEARGSISEAKAARARFQRVFGKPVPAASPITSGPGSAASRGPGYGTAGARSSAVHSGSGTSVYLHDTFTGHGKFKLTGLDPAQNYQISRGASSTRGASSIAERIRNYEAGHGPRAPRWTNPELASTQRMPGHRAGWTSTRSPMTAAQMMDTPTNLRFLPRGGPAATGAAARRASLDLRVPKIVRNKNTLRNFFKKPKMFAYMVESNPEGAKRILAKAAEFGVPIPKAASSAVASATKSSAASAGVADDVAKLAAGADDVVKGGAKKGIGGRMAAFLLGGPEAVSFEDFQKTRSFGPGAHTGRVSFLGLGRDYKPGMAGNLGRAMFGGKGADIQRWIPKVNVGNLGGNLDTGLLRGQGGKFGYGMSRSAAHLGKAVRAPAIIGGLIEAGLIKYRHHKQGKYIDEQLGALSASGDVEGFKQHMNDYNKRRLKEEKYAIGATIGGIGGAALATAALPLLAGGPPGWAAFLAVMAAGMVASVIGGGYTENSDADWVNHQARKQLGGNVIFGDPVGGKHMEYNSLMTQDQREAFDRATRAGTVSGEGMEVDPLQQVRGKREAKAYTVKRSRYKVPVYGYKTYRSSDPRFPGRIMRQRVQTGWKSVRGVKKTRIGGYKPPTQSGVGMWWNTQERLRIAKQRKERFANTDERGMYKGHSVDYWNRKEIQESYKRWNLLDGKYKRGGATPMGRPDTGTALPTDATGMPDPSMFGPASQPRITAGTGSPFMGPRTVKDGDVYGKFRNSDDSVDWAGFNKWKENLRNKGAWGPHLEKTFTAAGLEGPGRVDLDGRVGVRGRSHQKPQTGPYEWWKDYPDHTSYQMGKGYRKGGYAGGFVPNFSLVAAELNNSYSNSGTRAVGLRGVGLVNTAETLGHHPRFSKPFVNPPEGSREGMLHKMRAISKTGINPYRIPNTSISSQGSIPEIDTSGAQSSLGALTQEFDNLKVVLAAGGFIPDSSGGGSSVTNNMTVHANGGTSSSSGANVEFANLVNQMGVHAMAIAKIPGGQRALEFANRPKTT